MTFVPKYQWLTEAGTPQCGNACDIVQIDVSAAKKFQVAFTPTEIIDENFDGNNIALPMEKIFVGLGSFGSGSGTGEYYGITFDLDLTNDNHFINSFSFIFEGQSYCYIFQALSDVLLINYTTVEYGDFTLVKLSTYFGSLLNPYDSYVYAFNEIMNPYGIFAIQNGTPSITVYGFPKNTQVTTGNIAPYNNIITDGVGTQTWGLNNFLPINNQVCFFQISGLNEVPGFPTATPSIFYNAVVSANKRMVFTINFTNSFEDELTLWLNIKDNFFADITQVSQIIDKGTNTVTFTYETSATPPSSYYFEFMLDSIGGEIFDSMVGFCFNSIKIETIERLSTINVEGCTTANVPFTEEYNDLYNSLITMDIDSLPNGLISSGKWKLTLTDDESNTWTSIIYETIDGTNCKTRNLMRLTWGSDCQFADIDYKNLPFINDIYVKGWHISQPIENKERVINTLSSGELEMVYNYSVEKKEFNFGVYTEFFYKTLQRAFEHKTITINGLSYKQDNDSSLVKKT